MTNLNSRRSLAWIGGVALGGLLLGLIVGTTVSAQDVDRYSPGEDAAGSELSIDESSDGAVGSDEVLILVIADSIDSEKNSAISSPLVAKGLADLSGFYVDDVDNYELQALYQLNSPLYGELVCTPKIGCGLGSDVNQGEAFRARLPQQLLRIPIGEDTSQLIDSITESCSTIEEDLPCPSALQEAIAAQGDWPAGGWIKVTAFRTKSGAEQFIDFALSAGVDRSDLTIVQARKTGGGYIGLGQEPDPRGTGPLLSELPSQIIHQE